ncbi:lantibiotic dehydratase [Kitasatospora sp. NPDC048540]|uniref:lantibiotic dehydratase n=1 Tax=Kitasatospora sp. NPDC048540 TaxID=3155634 RepID=UPI0033CF9DDB
MPYTAGPAAAASAAPADPDGYGYAVRSAPYALVRATVLRYPAQSRPAAAFRARLSELADLEAVAAASAPELCDALYAARAGHSPAFHRDVVLPLRRALHNGREPRPALLERLGDLPARVPQLGAWLALRARRAALLADLDARTGSADGTTPAALAAERTALAALCLEPALARAVALTSGDLLRAVERTGRGAGDRRARKEEPGVLRYALRASTKTSPLSWFTAVGWGPAEGTADAGAGDGFEADGLRTVVRANRTLVSALTEALLDAPHRRAGLPHRMTSTARITAGRAAYARSRVVFAGGRYLVTNEDEAELAAGRPLELLAAGDGAPATLTELTGRLADALDGPGANEAAAGYLARLAEAGLLVPTDPVAPQDADPLGRLADWLRTWPEDAALADRIDAIARLDADFATMDAARRPPLLAELADRWREVLAEAGRPVPAGGAPLTVLSEDVVAPRPVPDAGSLTPADHRALGELTALAELFDLGHLMRRITRDRFVARYGAGGTCRHPWEFGAAFAEAWEEAGRLAALDPRDRDRFPTGAAELAALRREVLDTAHATAPAGDPAADLVLPRDLISGLGDRLPAWATARPAGYAYFVQREQAAGGLLCVNHVYGGWGRFTSRFLDALDPAAAEAVREQIRRGLGEEARPAQIRPVGGFNANLHPLLVPDEIGPDRRWASIGEAEVDLVHDLASDQLRLRLRATGELLDVLYSGFLAPIMLPQRLAPFLSDQPHGVADFRALVHRHAVPAPGGKVVRSARLRHRHLVLHRRRWQLPAGVVAALRADLAADRAVPAATTARWRALLDLPEQLFLHPAPAAPAGRPADDFLAHLRRPKPHFLDLGNALHLRSLAKWLARHDDGVVLEEALPAPGARTTAGRAVELVVETYRAGRPR